MEIETNMERATCASIEALKKEALEEARHLQAEADDNFDVAKHFETASKFLGIMAELEMAGIEHTDAAMITMLIGLRERSW